MTSPGDFGLRPEALGTRHPEKAGEDKRSLSLAREEGGPEKAVSTEQDLLPGRWFPLRPIRGSPIDGLGVPG